MRQDRGRPAWVCDRSGGRSLDYESATRTRVLASAPGGPNGIYLFELGAQPGGPEGRSDTTAGSQPIGVVERPRSVPAPWSCLVVVLGNRTSCLLLRDTPRRTRYRSSKPIPRQSVNHLAFFIPGTTRPINCPRAATPRASLPSPSTRPATSNSSVRPRANSPRTRGTRRTGSPAWSSPPASSTP